FSIHPTSNFQLPTSILPTSNLLRTSHFNLRSCCSVSPVEPRRRFTVPLPNRKPLVLGERTVIMGVINVTPDSFSDGGALLDPAAAVEAGVRMVGHGAGILDIGGESTRPGASTVDAAEEQRRVIPVVEALAKRVDVPISIDTYKAATAAASASAVRYEAALGAVVARAGAAIVLMHTRGRSRDMYRQASYGDVVAEVLDELRESISFATGAGLPQGALLIDPGLGFAKEAPHSFEALARLDEFSELGRPLVAGPSRKSFLGR